MPPDNLNRSRQTKLPFRLKAIGAVVMSAMIMSSASAAGLGRLTVLSSLGQPLNAEIELTSVSIEELGSLTVRLASAEAFRQANIELNPALLALRFAVEQRSGRQVVHVTSTQPINDPFVDMLLEVGGASGKLVREYTFLLDPAELRRPQSAMLAPGASSTAAAPARAPQITAPATATSSTPATSVATAAATTAGTPAVTGSTKATPSATASNAARRSAGAPRNGGATASAPAAASTASSAAPASRPAGEGYKVKSGDTLAGIATQYKHDGVSLDQMLVAMQKANPNAFAGNNINRLRSGQVLTVPDRAAAASTDAPEARRIVVAQLADFNGYKERLAAQVVARPNRTADATRQSSSGKVTARIEETPTPASEARDKLKLSKSGTTAGETTTATAMTSEERIAANKALADANARVAALEKNVGELQALLELKNKDLAERQNQASNVTASPATDPAATATPATPAAGSKTPEPAAATPAATPDATPAATPAATAPDSTTSPAAPVATTVTPTAPTEAARPEVAAPAPAPAAEPGLVGRLTENPLMLALIALAVAAGGALGLRRLGAGRKKEFNGDDGNTLSDTTALKANSIFAATGGQSVDTNNSVFNSNFAPSATQLDTNEVDPVAEADVYIAYGRDVQAEEILKEALRTQPERNAVRVKLLEIYASRPDKRAFESAATDLYSRTNGEGDEWQQAAVLGYGLDPSNPMYASGRPEVPELNTDGADDLDLDALLNSTKGGAAADAGNAGDIPALDGKNGDKSDGATSLPLATPDMPAGVSSASFKSPAAAEDKVKPLDNSMDFDLGRLGKSDTPDVPELVESDAKFDVNDLDFEIADPKKSLADKDDKAGSDVSSGFDIPEIDDVLSKPAGANADANAKAGTGGARDGSSSKDFDLSNIDLSLDADSAAAVGADAAADGSANTAEMATKLDLALAYQEIGDEDGARELLTEVVKGGSSDQAGRAKVLLEKLS